VDPTPVPNLYAAFRFDDAVTVGLGVNAPFGLKTEFHPGWFGRYDAIEASLRTINVSLVAGYKIDSRLSIGGGIDLQYARATLSSAIPNPLALGGPTAATDARVGTVGHDWSPGFNVGVLYKLDPNGRTRVGAHYRSGMKHELEGSTAITGFTGVLAGFNGLFDVRSDLRLPAIATVGVRHELPNGVVLLGEIEWFDWSKFKEVRTRFNNGSPDAVRQTNYRDAWAFAVGAEYKVPRTDWTARGGVQLDKTPTTDAWRDTTVPDADRLWLGVGATYRFSKKVSLDMAFNHVFLRDTSIAVRRTFDGGTTAVTSGAATNVVNTIAADLRVSY
jgi:long-chain fatty acid transport protein